MVPKKAKGVYSLFPLSRLELSYNAMIYFTVIMGFYKDFVWGGKRVLQYFFSVNQCGQHTIMHVKLFKDR